MMMVIGLISGIFVKDSGKGSFIHMSVWSVNCAQVLVDVSSEYFATETQRELAFPNTKGHPTMMH